MESQPKISIVTICFNAVETIEKTILSVLNQTYDNIEYIIIDGSSTDGTVDIIKKYAKDGEECKNHNNIVSYWLSEPDKGIYDAMNKGILAASGDWINFMNAGDTFYNENVLTEVSGKLDNNAKIAYGQLMKVYKRFKIIAYPAPITLNELQNNARLPHQAMFSKAEYQKLNLFDTSYKSAADYKFYYNAHFVDHCIFQYLPILIANYDSESGMSKDNYMGQVESLKVQGHLLNNNQIKRIRFRYKIINFLKKTLPEKIISWSRKRKFSKLGYTIIDR